MMAKLRITFEVDTIELFDRIHAINGNCAPLGERLVGAMMTGHAGMADSIGMAFYGVSIVGVEQQTAERTPADDRPG